MKNVEYNDVSTHISNSCYRATWFFVRRRSEYALLMLALTFSIIFYAISNSDILCIKYNNTNYHYNYDALTQVPKLANERLFEEFMACNKNPVNGIWRKAVLIFFDSRREDAFLHELKWLFESIKETNKYNTRHSVIDLLVYSENVTEGLTDMGCVYENVRNMYTGCCILHRYNPIFYSSEGMPEINPVHLLAEEKVFFKKAISYPYTFSITVIFDNYETYKNYDFVMRADADTFVLPNFAFNVPLNCCMITGMGGYSTEFSNKRLKRISKDMGWNHADVNSLGSTWVGTPMQVRIASEMTFRAMSYMAKFEFTHEESKKYSGIFNWPDWHFGVCSMYGLHLAFNHLIAEGYCINTTSQTLDCQSTRKELMHETKCWHAHVWHTNERFSKFEFVAHRYRDVSYQSLNISFLNDYLTMIAKRSDNQIQ